MSVHVRRAAMLASTAVTDEAASTWQDAVDAIPDLLVHYKQDEASVSYGSPMADSSGNNHPDMHHYWQYPRDTLLDDGSWEYAAGYNVGTNYGADIATTGGHPSWIDVPAFSLVTWVNFDDAVINRQQTIAACDVGGSPGDLLFRFFVNSAGKLCAISHYPIIGITSTVVLDGQTTYCVAYESNGTTMKVRVDGEVVASDAVSTIPLNTTGAFTLGGEVANNGDRLQAGMGPVAAWSRILTDDEHLSLSNGGRGL